MSMIVDVLYSARPAAMLAGTSEDLERIEACGPTDEQSWLCGVVHEVTGSVGAAEASDALSRPLRVLAIVIGAWILTRVLRIVIRRAVKRIGAKPARPALDRARSLAKAVVFEAESPTGSERRAQRAETIGVVLRSVGVFVVWTFALFAVLDAFAIDIGPLVAGAGFLGVAFGFGAQRLIQDFTSGLFMIVEDQFGVGDVIDVGDTTGTVEGVSLRTTRVRDVTGVLWHVPNGEIRRVANHSQKWARAVLDIDVAYETDIDVAKQVILDAAMAMYEEPEWKGDEILEPPEVWGVEAFGADAVSIRLVVKTAPLDQWIVAREMRARIKQAFDREGIEIPFPQRTVWIRTDSAVQVDDDGADPNGGDDQ